MFIETEALRTAINASLTTMAAVQGPIDNFDTNGSNHLLVIQLAMLNAVSYVPTLVAVMSPMSTVPSDQPAAATAIGAAVANLMVLLNEGVTFLETTDNSNTLVLPTGNFRVIYDFLKVVITALGPVATS